MKTLQELAIDLYDAKDAENAAKANRIEIEEQILALVPCADAGSATVQAGKLKVTVRKGISFSADVPAMVEDLGTAELLPLLPTIVVREFNEKAYLQLEKDDPELFKKVSQYVTSKPKKPVVTLKI